jgi:glycosyltransferase involved in cell wall biosynthesis
MPHESVPLSTDPRRLRIGIWCDYGYTITPKAGIGVFVYNLIAGLLSLEEPVEVVMLVRPGDQGIVSYLQKRAGDRLRVAPAANSWGRWLQWAQIARSALSRFTTAIHCLPTRGISYVAPSLRELVARGRKGNWPAILAVTLGIALAPAAFLFLWTLYAGYRLIASAFHGVFYPLRILAGNLRQFGKEQIYNPLATAEACDCDVWLIPFAGFPNRLIFPAVLVIHDLIHVHFPDTEDPDLRLATDQNFRSRAAEATLCACMSNFIRDYDLKGVLRLPDEKIRVIRPAPPDDLASPSSELDGASARSELSHCLQSRLARPYVFYPSDFRPHKNHQVLIETLHWLRTHLGEDSFDLVFTGMRSIPENLTRLIKAYGLISRVHVLGCVARSMLADLYRGAVATLVPSLYEQGSFPIYEALHWRCPVACSDIPSLREQCAAMGDAMIYFDPRNPEAIAHTVLKIRNEYESIRARQYAASRVMWQRTWQDVAGDWLAVFHEAAEIARNSDASSLSAKTAA